MKRFLYSITVALFSAALFTGSVAVAASLPGFSSPQPAAWQTAQYENILGTSMELKLNARSQADAERAEQAVLQEIQRLNGILSGYEATSEFRRWTATQGEAVPVSKELAEVLQLWDAWRARTGGALNPAAEAILRVWKNAAAEGKLPAEADLAKAVAAAQTAAWQLTGERATHVTDTPLLLNSFTKSYIVERAADAAMRSGGIEGVVVNIGGDLVVRGALRDTVDIADPLSDAENAAPIATLNIKNQAVATSGNYRRGYDIGGQHYSHIVDPRTGQTAEEIVSSTVVAPRGVDAGALATALSILSPEESRRLAESVDGAEYLLVRRDGSHIASPGWPLLLAQNTQAAKSAPAASGGSGQWDSAFELTVNVELPQAQGWGARRPYLAVWVEDKDRFPVRTMALWFNKPRWLNELRAWYRGDRLRALSEGTDISNSVSSATRAPGKYTFKWDGKDNNGKLVKAGKYTVFIEGAREHGGYSLLRREIDFNGQPVQAQIPADVEVGAVTLDYHKVVR